MQFGLILGNGIGAILGGALGWRLNFAVGSVIGLLTLLGYMYYGDDIIRPMVFGCPFSYRCVLEKKDFLCILPECKGCPGYKEFFKKIRAKTFVLIRG